MCAGDKNYSAQKSTIIGRSPKSVAAVIVGPDSIYIAEVEMSSLEHTTILKCASQLETSLRSDRDILVMERFISERVYDNVLDPRSMFSASDKAGLLVTGIRKKVKTNSQYFSKLMRYFYENKDKYVDIIQTLEDSYSASPALISATTLSHEEHSKVNTVAS